MLPHPRRLRASVARACNTAPVGDCWHATVVRVDPLLGRETVPGSLPLLVSDASEPDSLAVKRTRARDAGDARLGLSLSRMSRRLDLRSRCLSEGGVGRESSRPQETLVVVDERRPRPALSELGLTNRAAPRFGDAILSRTRRRRKGASARGRPAGRVFARATAVCHDMLAVRGGRDTVRRWR